MRRRRRGFSRWKLSSWLLVAVALLACGVPRARLVLATPAPVEAELLGQLLPARDDVIEEGGRWYWRADETRRYAILRGVNGRWVELETPEGPVRASWGLLAAWNREPLRDLRILLGHVREAELDLAALTLSEDGLAGSFLYGERVYVIREGVLRRVDSPRLSSGPPQEARIERLRSAVAAVKHGLESADVTRATREALADILSQIAEPDEAVNIDYLPPAFARRLVRHGWPSQLDVDPELLVELRRAVRSAEALHPRARFVGDAGELTYWSNAVGGDLWTISTPKRAGYSVASPAPAYFYDTRPTTLVVRLPPGSDPLHDVHHWQDVELYHDDERIAAWRDGAFSFELPSWRRAYPLTPELADPGQLEDALPPHIVVTRPDGDVLALVTPHGVLRPALDGSPGESTRFFAEAAEVLPSAAYLDLIGQHLVVYAYDSPDTRRPGLLGTRQIAGDIHQTASQTLDTQTGGMYRGDCDDLSELYFEIAQRQGRTAHLIGLPAHAALAWAVGDVRGWSTYVLHTGQPRRFTAPTLRESLERAYKSFGAGEVLDFTKLEILLRFSGENTRSSWYLSDRVFADPGYARAMIDVQRDWHFQTYQRAIVKMRHMLRDGDVDAGNLSELAGLYHYTGQYARAADTLADAVASAGSAQTRLSMQIDRLHALYRSGQRERADALARALRSEQIPELEGQMDQPLIEPRISLVDGLIDFRANPALGLEVLAEDVAPRVDPLVVQLGGILADQPGAEWTGGPEDALRYQLRWYVSTIVRALSVTRDSALREHPARAALAASAARWIESVGFRDLDSSESVLARYAVLGRLHRGTRGAGWEAQLRVAAPLEEVHIDHTARSPASEALDLSWIAASPTYWSGELAGLFAERHASVDTSRVPELVDRVIATRARAVALGLDHPNFDATERDALLLRALVEQDAGLLRRLLREVRIAADRRERMDVSTWIATVARAVPLEWYRQVIEIFREELNYKPMYFWIAWNAALLGAHPQALHVADVAAAEFPDDPAFAEERDSMWGRFSSEARGTARASAR